MRVGAGVGSSLLRWGGNMPPGGGDKALLIALSGASQAKQEGYSDRNSVQRTCG